MGKTVMAVNCKTMDREDVFRIMEQLLADFFRLQGSISCFLSGLNFLQPDNWLKQDLIEKCRNVIQKVHTMKDIQDDSIQMQAPYIKDVYIRDKQLENGVVNLSVDFEDRYYYEILSEMVGTNIEGEYDLISLLKELSGMRNNYESLAVACNQVRGKGYGIVPPEEKEIQIADPELIRHGNKYGVKIKASCPSMHIIQANIETEIAPIVGSEEEQAKDLIDYISQNAKKRKSGWHF